QSRGARLGRLLRQLLRRPLFVIGLLIVSTILLAALLAPLIAPCDPFQVRMDNVLKAPSALHLFGTDELGRDVLSRVLYGARISVLEGLFAVFIAVVLGVPLGMAAGYAGGFVESAIMRIVDVMLAFPGVLLAVVIVAILGPSLVNAMVAVGLYTMPI
ncbi:ABC transporter permease, partial [Salmonella enterica subsp. enterica serovar Newport]|nr:ABC transporter permease [Salmonella enterica subsp. enterica serovar Newport]